jgi:hypothetical protein
MHVQILSAVNLYPIPRLGQCIAEAPTQTVVCPMDPVDMELANYVSISTVDAICISTSHISMSASSTLCLVICCVNHPSLPFRIYRTVGSSK